MNDDLEPIEPSEAIELYLNHRRDEVSEATLRGHKYRLRHFKRWAQGAETQDGTSANGQKYDDTFGESRLTNMNELTGRDLHRFRTWRQTDGDLSQTSLRTQMSTVRTFLKFCENIDAVPAGMHDKTMVPSLSGDEKHRDRILTSDEAEAILDHLETYQYASLDHALLTLLWHSGVRIGGAYSLDVDDVDFDNQRMQLMHRPDQGTGLKNGDRGERVVALGDTTTGVLTDYIEVNRPSTTDQYGRRPLFASREGRLAKSTLRVHVYRWTQPCRYADECPLDRNPKDCEAFVELDRASRCPENVSPHDIRRGAITHFLQQDVPEGAVSDRCNVSTDVIDEYYDKRAPEEKAEQRRRYFTD